MQVFVKNKSERGLNKMTSRTNVFKKTMCFLLIIVLLLSSWSLTVFAIDESKTANYSSLFTCIINASDFDKYANSPASYVSQTYYYNDGTYRGTLNLTRAMCWSPTYISPGVLQVRINAEYSGTVYARRTKTVTNNYLYTQEIDASYFNNYANSPASYVPQTYYYNDGTYSGNLSLTSAVCWSPSYISPGRLMVRIDVTYSGTVTER